MKKNWKMLCLLLSVLLGGLLGCACAQRGEDPAEPASVVEVDLSRGMKAVESREKVEAETVKEQEEGEEGALRVLIYHTHTYEAYEPDEQDPYQPTEQWRTADNDWNMVAVGRALARELQKRGCSVVHDDTAFEPPDLDYAYERSLEALENYRARGEEFDIYIDLHRDAYAQNGQQKNTVTVDGVETARVMFLIGTGEGSSNGKPFDPKPQWENNLAYAQKLTEEINRLAPGVCRQVTIRTGRYNQHVSPKAVLIEVGNNRNTLQEALAAMPLVAQAIAQIR